MIITIMAKCQDTGTPRHAVGFLAPTCKDRAPGWAPKPEQLSNVRSQRSPPFLEQYPITGKTVLELLRCNDGCHQLQYMGKCFLHVPYFSRARAFWQSELNVYETRS